MTAPAPAADTSDKSVLSRAPKTWKPPSRQVAFELLLLFGAYLFWLSFLVLVTRYHWSSGQTKGPGSAVASPTTAFQEEPGFTRALLTCAAIAILIEAANVLWRVARHSTRPGVTGMIAAGLGGAVALFGLMTIGMFVAPFAGICIVLALPIGSEPSVGAGSLDVPPGWRGDPFRRSQWRFWDGRVWTGLIASNDQGGVGSLS